MTLFFLDPPFLVSYIYSIPPRFHQPPPPRELKNDNSLMWNWSFNTPCKSLKVILVLFEEEESYAQDDSKFYNPKIENVSVTVEGNNQTYFYKGNNQIYFY